MSTDWTGKIWEIVSSGCGLALGDLVRFVNSDVQVKPTGSESFTSWGTYFDDTASGCLAQTVSRQYTIHFDQQDRNKLICTSNSEGRADEIAATDLGLLWDAPPFGSAGTPYGLFLSQAEGPGPSSWIAEEGG